MQLRSLTLTVSREVENMQNEPQKLVTEKVRGSCGEGWSEEFAGRRGVGRRLGGSHRRVSVNDWREVYGHGGSLRQDLEAARGIWVAERPGGSDGARPELLIRTAVEWLLSELAARGHGTSHRLRAKSAISGFCVWLIEEKGVLRRNSVRGIEIAAQPSCSC